MKNLITAFLPLVCGNEKNIGESTMSKYIGTSLSGLALIALLGVGAEVNATNHFPGVNMLDCDRCVDSSDIAPRAVGTSHIQSDAITTTRLKTGAVTTRKIKGRAVTTAKIRDGAVTVSKVAPELSNAIGTFCEIGDVVVGMAGAGCLTVSPISPD